ncbi:MAG: DUF5993 family protein [Deltaproteobacteria bacterium]
MMAALFLLFVVTMLLAWYGKRRASIYLFFITLVLCALWFRHHITEHLNINL